jgi:hypothetical protein
VLCLFVCCDISENSTDPSTPPGQLTLPPITNLAGGNQRTVSLHEEVYEPVDIPVAALLGTGGFKDTVIAYPEEITRIRARFDTSGLFVWHCHIVEHEDNEMMRPYYVGTIPGNLPL